MSFRGHARKGGQKVAVFSIAIAVLLFVLGAIPALVIILPSLVRYANRRDSTTVSERSETLWQEVFAQSKEIVVVAGELNPWVFDDAADLLATELAKPNREDVRIRILCGPKIGRRSDKQPSRLRNYVERGLLGDRVTIRYLATRPVLHFGVGDGRHGYVEATHADGCDELLGTREVHVFRNSIFKGPDLVGQFERLWASGPFIERPEEFTCNKD